uniref:pentatricopeptide repeat-containing protein At1g11290, chloroplastic-like n=1 Tax=Erigeron canadensis TaxID=72917 RepID=UPI001CB988CF|nr:pentatricopeptide repeat-containing protein At1g11290, chloroplastic-like [Erigeron canadensis]
MRIMKNQPDGFTGPDLVTWSALISGFSQSGEYRKALVSFKKMNVEGRKQHSIVIATLLAVTALLVVLSPGIEIHGYAICHNLDTEIMVSSSWVDMHSKCGFLDLGIKVFEQMQKRNIVSYNLIIESIVMVALIKKVEGFLREWMLILASAQKLSIMFSL